MPRDITVFTTFGQLKLIPPVWPYKENKGFLQNLAIIIYKIQYIQEPPCNYYSSYTLVLTFTISLSRVTKVLLLLLPLQVYLQILLLQYSSIGKKTLHLWPYKLGLATRSFRHIYPREEKDLLRQSLYKGAWQKWGQNPHERWTPLFWQN